MSEREKQKVSRAIELLYDDDGWDRAIEILMALIGKKYQLRDLSKKGKHISLARAAQGPNRPFTAKEAK